MSAQYSQEYIKEWWLMDTPAWPIGVTLIYLLIVLYIGPRFMKNRPPFQLRGVIIAYNLFIVACSYLWLYKLFQDKPIMDYYFGSLCRSPIEPNDTSIRFHNFAWWYQVSKYVELLDTVFFVLRKKWNQVTFLHVYHHSNVVLLSWVIVRYLAEGDAAFTLVTTALNTGIHFIMYIYYMLAAMGPRVRKYLWFKRYITSLQMIQFSLMILYGITQVLFRCQVNSLLTTITILNALGFLILFSFFYKKTYKSTDTVNKSK